MKSFHEISWSSFTLFSPLFFKWSYITDQYLFYAMSENVTNEENDKKTVRFKVSPHEYNVLKQYTAILHNQMIQDPETGKPRRMLEKHEICLLIRNATYSYLVQYQYMMQQQAKIDAANQQQQQGQQVKTNA